MTTILMSMKSEWWDKILSGEKELEIRKTAPAKVKDWPIEVLVYISGTGKICGGFTCPGIIKTNNFTLLEKRSCLSNSELESYANGKSLYGWIVEKPHWVIRPCPLREVGLDWPPQSWKYLIR